MKLVSFDIFDTTLVRKCGAPENIFYLLANRIFGSSDKCAAYRNSFFLWRRKAEACLCAGQDGFWNLSENTVTRYRLICRMTVNYIPKTCGCTMN